MNNYQPLEHGNYYHIYNRGNNRESLFMEPPHYEHFLGLLDKYIPVVADVFAWVLMGNHSHFLVRIKEKEEIGYYLPLNSDGDSNPTSFLNSDRSNDSVMFKTSGNLSESAQEGPDRVGKKKPNPTRHFSHLFNAYTKYYNKHNDRTGSLFSRPFERRVITTEKDLRNVVLYIHHNPVHHGFTDKFWDYPWSSYDDIVSTHKTFIKREEVIGWFDDIENFKTVHFNTINKENDTFMFE